MKNSCLRKIAGFTLIELLVVMAIAGILFAIGVVQYTKFNRGQTLDQTTQELKNNLRLAQTMALNGEKPEGCSVLDGYRLSFSSGDAANPDNYQIQAICGGNPVGTAKTFSLPLSVRFSPLPSSPVLFKVLVQGTNLSADLIISLAGFGQTKIITVSKAGKIE